MVPAGDDADAGAALPHCRPRCLPGTATAGPWKQHPRTAMHLVGARQAGCACRPLRATERMASPAVGPVPFSADAAGHLQATRRLNSRCTFSRPARQEGRRPVPGCKGVWPVACEPVWAGVSSVSLRQRCWG